MAKLPRLSKLDKELLTWVGLCITEWAAIDHLLFRLTQLAPHVGSRRAAIVYERIATLGARIAFVDDLVGCIIDATRPEGSKTKSDMEKQWISVARELRELIEIRNKLAHWRRTTMSRRADTGEMSEPIPVLAFNQRDFYRGKKSLLKSTEITPTIMSDHYTRVGTAITNLKDFMHQLAEKMPSLAPSPQSFLQRYPKSQTKSHAPPTKLPLPPRSSRA